MGTGMSAARRPSLPRLEKPALMMDDATAIGLTERIAILDERIERMALLQSAAVDGDTRARVDEMLAAMAETRKQLAAADRRCAHCKDHLREGPRHAYPDLAFASQARGDATLTRWLCTDCRCQWRRESHRDGGVSWVQLGHAEP